LSPLARDGSGRWLVGAHNLQGSVDAGDWEPIGGHGYPVNDILRQPHRLVCATHWGLWEVLGDPPGWRQLHDETLTEVLGIAACAGDPGVVAVSAYGLAFGERGEHGATHWRSRSDDLSLNERFSNAVLALPDAPGHWLIGTEDGVIQYDESTAGWHRTDLKGRPCRVLLHAFDRLWAGTDEGGIWCSADGISWRRAGTGLDDGTVFALAASADRILAGTLRGVCVGDGSSAWQRLGPRLLVSAIAAHPSAEGPWLAGATPGGLWRSDDGGRRWGQIDGFDTVRVILPPEAAP
jgi:hypothetical protein